MLTVAYYSEGSTYEQEAALLAASLNRVGMVHHIEAFESKGNWYANTAEKARFLCRMREKHTGPLLYIDVDAFVHQNCDAYFEELGHSGYDFGAHYYRGAKGGRPAATPGARRMLSGTLYLGDTDRCRELLSNWRALNELWRSVGLTQGGGQKNLWFTTTCMEDLKIAQLPGAYCYAFDRAEFYLPGTVPIIEHTIASRDHRATERQTASRAARVAQLRRLLTRPRPGDPPQSEMVMHDPMREYWTERHKRQGRSYVARGGKLASYTAQHDAVSPILRKLLYGHRVLDFGCGPQRFRDVIEEDGREYVGVDLIPGLGTEPLADELPRGFDSAIAIWVLQHIVDPKLYEHWTRELYRSLKPGGRLIVLDHAVMPDMEGHMAPRGIETLRSMAPWTYAELAGEYDGHWVGVLARGSADLPAEELVIPTASPPALPLALPLVQPVGQAALVLGGASCVWEDVRRVEAMIGHPWDGLVIAVNDVGSHWPRRLDHWCTLHPEKMPAWVKDRAANGHPDGYTTWARRGVRGIHRTIESWAGGSSGLLGVAVAFQLECQRIIPCGVPMNRDPHFAESKVHPKGKPWTSCDAHWKSWTKGDIVAKMRGRVKSMSGRTKDLLGAPTPEWLGVEQAEEVAA